MDPLLIPDPTVPPAFEEGIERVRALLVKVIQHGRFDLSFEIRREEAEGNREGFENPEVVLNFTGTDSDLLLQAHAELLNALEYVVLKATRLEDDLFGRISFDCSGYRQLRVEELKLMAVVAA